MDSVEDKYKTAEAEVERASRGISLQEANVALAKSSITEIRLRENDVTTLEKELVSARTDENIAKAVVEAARAQKAR